jgi:DNA-binding transcriptional MerR regulator
LQAEGVAPDRGRDLIPIGRFAKRANLSPRQLRYYHALGLLMPAAVDPESGYRYYAETQRATAELIALLRSIDMPVPEIQSLLADRSPANVRAVFDRLRTRIEERLRHAREILGRIDTLILEDTLMEQKQAVYPYQAFTEESREVLLLTQKVAEDAGHGYIGTEHMLAALASESAGDAGLALRRLGLDTDTVVRTANTIVAERGGAEPGAGQLVPNAALRDVIAEAFRAAGVDPAAAGEQVIATSSLLRCTLSVSHGEERGRGAIAVLQRLNVPASQVVEQLGA